MRNECPCPMSCNPLGMSSPNMFLLAQKPKVHRVKAGVTEHGFLFSFFVFLFLLESLLVALLHSYSSLASSRDDGERRENI